MDMTMTLDTEQQARRNSVVYRCLTPSPAQALLFGNGTMGGSVYTPDDSLRIQVARGDIWNEHGHMGAIAAVRVRGNPGLFARARAVRQECSLAEASITINVDEVTFRLTAIRGHDVLVLDIEDGRKQPEPFTVTLENWHEGDEITLTETIHVNRTSDFEALNRKVGIEPGQVPVADPLLGRAWGLFLNHRQPRRILIATACSMAGADAVRQAGHQMLAAARTQTDGWLVEHRRWWVDFWSRSGLSLSSATGDAEYEERLWYVTLYTIACGSGGPYPLRFNGGPFLLDRDARSWDGGYHLSPVSALETWLDVRDDMPNLCGLHYFLPRAIAWGEQFGEQPAVLDRWRDFLKHLAPLPVGRWTVTRKFLPDLASAGIHNEEYTVESELRPDGLFLPAAGLLKDKSLRRNMENAELYVIFPWGFVGMDSSSQEVRRAENTWNNRTWRYPNNGWAQDAVQLARMGWADRAKESLLDHASYSQRFPNGCFICAAAPLHNSLVTDTPYFDASGVHATALNEMLLQSYDGTIRLCPATTAEWSGCFKLHALGGLIVEAAFEHGQPVAAQITASRPAQLRVRWRGELVERDMRAGETFALGREPGILVANVAAPEIVYPGYKIHPPLRAHSTGHWHDERKGHGQIGLAEDGQFPATRGAKATMIQ